MISLSGRSVGATCVLHPPEEPLFRFVDGAVPLWLAWLTIAVYRTCARVLMRHCTPATASTDAATTTPTAGLLQ